jgi:multidrug efflux pump subunit AcrA (membrane-fusion protein)
MAPEELAPRHEPMEVAQSPQSEESAPRHQPIKLALRLLPMGLVTSLAVLWAVSPSVEVEVEGSGVLLQPDSRVGIYARSAGQVQKLFQLVGAPIAQGDLVASLDRIDQAAPGGGLVPSNPDALRRQGQAIDKQKAAIRAQIANLTTTNQPVARQLQALESLRQQEVIPRYSPLWVGAQDLYLRNQSQIKALEGQLAVLDASQAELDGQRLSQEVLAPRSGRLLSLSVAPGQAVAPGQRIGTIGPAAQRADRPRSAVGLFSDADAARLRPGDEIKLDPLLQSRDRYGGTTQRYGSVIGRIVNISPSNADLAEVSRVVGDPELATSLMARSRQAALGEGGDPMATAADKLIAPVVLVTVALEGAATASGLRWSSGLGPDLRLENGTPAKLKVVVERRSPVSYLMPFLRWLGGAQR